MACSVLNSMPWTLISDSTCHGHRCSMPWTLLLRFPWHGALSPCHGLLRTSMAWTNAKALISVSSRGDSDSAAPSGQARIMRVT
jgi:hypothetical protein